MAFVVSRQKTSFTRTARGVSTCRRIAALHERSRIYMQLANATADPYVKEQFRTHALALTHRAEIEREQEEAEECEKTRRAH
jgi:hypothetical protein